MDFLKAMQRGGVEQVGGAVQALTSGRVPKISIISGKDEASLFADAMGRLSRKMREEEGLINWLRVAIGLLGNQSEAAQRLGVTRQAVSDWLKPGLNGMRDCKYRDVERLSELSGIPLNLIGQCGKENEPLEPGAVKRTGKQKRYLRRMG
jgi:hypothetical protein